MALDDVTQRILDDTKLKVDHFLPVIGLESYTRFIAVKTVDVSLADNVALGERLRKREFILQLYNWIWIAALGSGAIYFAYLKAQYQH